MSFQWRIVSSSHSYFRSSTDNSHQAVFILYRFITLMIAVDSKVPLIFISFYREGTKKKKKKKNLQPESES